MTLEGGVDGNKMPRGHGLYGSVSPCYGKSPEKSTRKSKDKIGLTLSKFAVSDQLAPLFPGVQ